MGITNKSRQFPVCPIAVAQSSQQNRKSSVAMFLRRAVFIQCVRLPTDSSRYKRLPVVHRVSMTLKQAPNALWCIATSQNLSWQLRTLCSGLPLIPAVPDLSSFHLWIHFTFCTWHSVHASGTTLPMATWIKTLFPALLPKLFPGPDPFRRLLPALSS